MKQYREATLVNLRALMGILEREKISFREVPGLEPGGGVVENPLKLSEKLARGESTSKMGSMLRNVGRETFFYAEEGKIKTFFEEDGDEDSTPFKDLPEECKPHLLKHLRKKVRDRIFDRMVDEEMYLWFKTEPSKDEE